MGLGLNVSRRASNDIVELLSSTVYGTPGKTRFQHTGVDTKVAKLAHPYFLTLRKGDRLLGVANFNLKEKILPHSPINHFYIRYFSFLESLRLKKPTGKRGGARNKIKEEIVFFMEKGGFDEKNHKAMYFAYIEMENERSKNMVSSLGFKPIRRFTTSLFSRFYPKADKAVKEIAPDQTLVVKELLQDFYEGYTMYDTEYLFNNGKYFVLMEDGEIVAGVQAVKTTWRVKELPGWSGKILLLLLPHIPFISRIFNPGDYSFLSLEYLYVKKGREKLLNTLFESVCAIHNLNNAMIWSDTNSTLHDLLKKYLAVGLLEKLHKSVPAHIVARYTELEKEEIDRFENSPAYISAFDLT